MAIVGLKMVRLALVDPKTQKLLKGADGLSTDGVIEACSVLVPLTSQTLKVKRLKSLGTTQCKTL